MLGGEIFSTSNVRMRPLIAAFFTAVFLLAPAGHIFALSSGGIGGYPAHADPGIQYSDSWFIYNLDLGESKEDSVLLTNHSDATETLKLYAVDSVATGDGNFSLKGEKDPRTGIGAWIQLSQSSVTLAPGEERELPFVITIPESTDVGEHSGGIILEKTQAGTAAIGQNSASIITRVGIRVYETVPGELIRKVEPADFKVTREVGNNKKPVYRIELSALNKSNVSLKAHATVHITGWGRTKYFPKSHFKDGFNFDYSDLYSSFQGDELNGDWQLLRDQQVSTSWEWPEPAFGHYAFKADITYDGTNGPETFSTESVSITVIPWMLLIVLSLLVLLFIAYLFWHQYRMSGRGWKSYAVKAGEQLPDIANSIGVSWKRLAAVNKIKAPYLIKTGQSILVPGAASVPAQTPKAQVEAAPVAAMPAPEMPEKKTPVQKIVPTPIESNPKKARTTTRKKTGRAPVKKKKPKSATTL